ncbi:hypothetical protein JCGZ_13225 [Jatropha curcas]|uniref:Uncharacterized protein n=1 Tax=Jatropha curcas TaxID=180498 RepID=A0A067KJ74_JATCU|nr:hypothetical protein JCGZ_13225 [Jatropha curcas]
MVPLLSRVTILENNTSGRIKIQESRPYQPECIELKRFGSKEIKATLYFRRGIESGRPMVFKLFIDGVLTERHLAPQHFIQYLKISFSVDNNSADCAFSWAEVAKQGKKSSSIEILEVLKGFEVGPAYVIGVLRL